MTSDNPNRRVNRVAHLRWVPISKMRVSPLAQRELNQARVDAILANLDLEQIGIPTLSERDDWFYIVDGQHRITALEAYGFGDDSLQCNVYTGLTEEDEAEMFLKLNNILPVKAMELFRVGVKAGREVETDIDRIVRAQGLKVTFEHVDGSIRAVGTLRRVYGRDGAAVLARALRIIRDSYGTSGFESSVIDGMGMLCARYNGRLDDETAVKQLAKAAGGVKGLLNDANKLREQLGSPKGQCVAAAAVKIINRARGVNLPSWWKSEPVE